ARLSVRDQPGGDLDADGHRQGPNRPGGLDDAEGGAPRRDRHPAHPCTDQVRAARSRRAAGSAAPREASSPPGRMGHVVRRDLAHLMEIEALPLEELADGSMRLLPATTLHTIRVYNVQ